MVMSPEQRHTEKASDRRIGRVRQLVLRSLVILGLSLHLGSALADTSYWFAPLPPLPKTVHRPFSGSSDFMDLFSQGAPWDFAAQHIQVFKFYGEWVSGVASDDQLIRAVSDLRRRGIALAVEVAPMAAGGCENGIESFQREWPVIARRIKAAGGTIDYIDLDEPYYYAAFSAAPQACHPSPEVV